ncbi:MAG TPA: hypothetical protein VMC82_06685 [Thermoplasmata archaeon]|nr:hypothetical protein [Thermoplasmata archaeon]
MGEVVDLVIDARRGEKISLELPLSLRTPPESAREELGLPEWVDVRDPIVARGLLLLRAARRASPAPALAILGGVANRMRCPTSNAPTSPLRRSLHDLDLACLHKELRTVRAFLESLHEREGSGLRVFETAGDQIFNSLSEGRRLRFHMVLGQQGSGISLGSIDLLADEFRFCHRFDLREDVASAARQHGTLSLPLLLLAKLQYIQRVPKESAGPVAERVLEPFGRSDVLIGPEAKDVQDVLALLIDHPLDESAGGISPSRLIAVLGKDWGLWKTVGLNVATIRRSPILLGLPESLRATAFAQLEAVAELLDGLSPKRRLAFLGGEWWEEVDAQPSVDVTARAG